MDRKPPFPILLIDTEPQEIRNPFSGDTVTLEPDAVAVYDAIIGAEYTRDFKTMQKGLAWFRKYFPKEYMALLD